MASSSDVCFGPRKGDYAEDLTTEQLIEYCNMVNASGGFDVPDLPPNYCCGQIMPLKALDDNPELLGEVIDHSKSAIQQYNNDNGTNYGFVNLVKANILCVAGFIFFITFDAKDKDGDDGRSKTFQAKVWEFQGNVEVQSCDKKRT